MSYHHRQDKKERRIPCTVPGCEFKCRRNADLKKHLKSHLNQRTHRKSRYSYSTENNVAVPAAAAAASSQRNRETRKRRVEEMAEEAEEDWSEENGSNSNSASQYQDHDQDQDSTPGPSASTSPVGQGHMAHGHGHGPRDMCGAYNSQRPIDYTTASFWNPYMAGLQIPRPINLAQPETATYARETESFMMHL
jgi:hypothetical protein